jgi:UDP-3-O-[3-hydroxymyristoyl] N-acetylglucosamine deacetylase/3-hydroxyacyl-[acyl-carrier-protein] dehydratase
MLNINEDVFAGENGMLNNKALRFPNEPCRHKTLDLLGDMFLCGAHVKAQILAARPGHKSNIEFAKLLREFYRKTELKIAISLVGVKGSFSILMRSSASFRTAILFYLSIQ